MDITIIRHTKKQVPQFHPDGTPEMDGALRKQIVEEHEDTLEDVFEVHPYETIGSVATRFAKKNNIGDPPFGEPLLAFNPRFTMKSATTKIMDLDGTKRFVLKVWKGG